MKKLAFILLALFALTAPTYGTDIDIGASSIVGFNTANAGVDTSLSGVTVTLGSPSVTCSSCLPTGAVGLSGMKVSLGTPAVTYDIASVASRSAFTLTSNYLAGSGTVTGTLHKFVHLRIYVLSPFIPSGSSTVVQSGAPGSTAWYRRYGVSIVNDGAQNVAFVPAIDNLPATTDSSVPTARYYAAFYTQGGGFMQSWPGCVDDWRLSHETTPTSWAQICTFNSPAASPPPQPINFYTTSQIDARFPSCTAGQMLYYAATGNVQSCLTPDAAQFTITGGVLSVNNVLNRIQEEGSNLPQRPTLNFAGSSLTCADDAGNTRTNCTAATPLNNLASIAANGFYAITGAGATSAVRTITGTANRIGVTNGDGVAGNPTLDIGSDVVTLTGSQTLTNKTLTSPRIGGGLLDVNGAAMLTFSPAASAVNGFTIFNSAMGVEPAFIVAGSDANIPLKLQAKGTEYVLAIPFFKIADTNSPHTRFIRTAATARTVDWGIDNSDNIVLSTQGVGTAFSVALSTQVATFNQPVIMTGIALASLGAPANGAFAYCNNCNVNTDPCTSGGTGAFAMRLNGRWRCQ